MDELQDYLPDDSEQLITELADLNEVSNGKRAVPNGEQSTTGINTNAVIRQAETNINALETKRSAVKAERTDTTAVIRQSETKVKSSGTSRNDRETEQERLRIEESRRIAEQLERERAELAERNKKVSKGGFSLD